MKRTRPIKGMDHSLSAVFSGCKALEWGTDLVAAIIFSIGENNVSRARRKPAI